MKPWRESTQMTGRISSVSAGGGLKFLFAYRIFSKAGVPDSRTRMRTRSAKPDSRGPEFGPVLEDCGRGVVAGRPHHSASRMRPRSAQIEPADRRAVRGPSRHRAEREHLVRQDRAVEHVAAREAILLFQRE